MDNPYEIKESPNKLNLTYIVKCMHKDTDLEFYFGWLVDELKVKQVSCERTIIYCQTIVMWSCLWDSQRYARTSHVCR